MSAPNDQTSEVSAIIPVRNAAATLDAALDSLRAQTMPDWEAIVVDDGSADASVAIAQAQALLDRRIRVLRTKAGGASAARNAGIEAARGRRLLFLDADDWVAPTHLERLVRLLAATPVASAAYCGYRRVMPDGNVGPATWRSDIATSPMVAFAHRPGTAIHAVLVDRDAVLAVGGFDPDLRTCEDWDLWQRLAQSGAKFVGLPEALAFYRTGESASLSRGHRQMVRDGLVVIRRGVERLGNVAIADWRLPATYLALWCAAAEAGAGCDGKGLLEKCVPNPLLNHDLDALCVTLVDGLSVGAAVVPEGLTDIWPRLGPALAPLVSWVERVTGVPGLARRLTYAIELHLLEASALTAPIALSLVIGTRVDLGRPRALLPPPGVDMALMRLCDGPRVLSTIRVPLLGPLAAREVAALAVEALGVGPSWRAAAVGRPSVWARALREAAPVALRAAAARLVPSSGEVPSRGLRAEARFALARAIVANAGPPPGPGSDGQVLVAILHRASVEAAAVPRATANTRLPKPGSAPESSDRGAYWEAVFSTPDPWDYGSAYEAGKYAHTLDLLPAGPIGVALELACAEGHFTRQLAPRVGRLTAADISERALTRAAERCKDSSNIAFRRLDLEADQLPAGLDLIVCSEVLYYLADEAALRRLAERVRDALTPGGHLVMAHAFVLADQPGRTGFDWDQPFGAATIARVFAATPGLVLESTTATTLYRIDRLRRGEASGGDLQVTATKVSLDAPLPAEVARQVVWDGAVARRSELRRSATTNRLPILMYHRIAEDGPSDLACFRVSPQRFEAQLRLLRRHGYHPISSAELRWFIGARHPMPGRPVLITFDDGYRDFRAAAWPILRANDFTAEVFLPTDLVGANADWDEKYGQPAPLLDWEDASVLAEEGVVFGSHLASHLDGLTLSTAALAEELARSRAVLEARLGREVRAYAAPYGAVDERFARLAARCGYDIGFSTSPGHARLDNPPLMLPRIEVRGEWDLDAFSTALEIAP
jgi:peptidoglycan/xylan/chitin deacetylase (PgdA/CDA1 family)/GT2 family glycosyltransferase